MRTRTTVRTPPAKGTRWAAWASQLLARQRRWAGASPSTLLLHVRSCRAPVLLYQRWLSFRTRVNPQLKMSVAARGAWHVTSTDVYAPLMLFLQSLGQLLQRSLSPETKRGSQQAAASAQGLEPLPATPVRPTNAGARQAAMTLALARARDERRASPLHKHFTLGEKAVFTEVSRRLARRVRQAEEVFVSRPRISFRKEAEEVAAAATPRSRPPEAAEEQSRFERRGGAYAAQATAMAELNVEQLADQVLKQIDRRVVARRERMGQV
jgi:hypothetical protein